jgi:acetyl-CoA C-acetyltransferase
MTSVRELALVHRIEEMPSRVEDSQGWDSVFDRDVVLLGQVQVFILAPDIDLHDDEAPLEEGSQLGFMHLRIQRMTVGSPVCAEDEYNVLLGRLGFCNRPRDIAMRVGLRVIDRRGRLSSGAAEQQENKYQKRVLIANHEGSSRSYHSAALGKSHGVIVVVRFDVEAALRSGARSSGAQGAAIWRGKLVAATPHCTTTGGDCTLPTDELGVIASSLAMREVFILSAVRTPIGKFGGSLRDFSAPDLGVLAAHAALERAGIAPEEVEETIFGHARQAGNGPNPGRQISVRAGIPESIPAYTVNKACASGMKAIVLGYQEIALGNAEVVLVGGVEAMSRIPYFAEGARWGARLGHQKLVDGMYQDGFFCPLAKLIMGETAELLAERYKISRQEQDAYALASQQGAQRAIESGRLKDEIVPIKVQEKKGERLFTEDEHPRRNTTVKALAKLPPVFSSSGTITAGNSSGITDAAAALVLVSEAKAGRATGKPLGRIVGFATAGVDPRIMGIGPVPAVQKLLYKTGRRLEDYELIELNEAFAAQVLACDRELHFDRTRLNVNGGAIALGHPIGCTGARITVTLLHEMQKRGARRGLATLCVSGGLGMALEVEAG